MFILPQRLSKGQTEQKVSPQVRKAAQPVICEWGSDCVSQLHPSRGECILFRTQRANRQHSDKHTTLFFGFGTSTTGNALTQQHIHTSTPAVTWRGTVLFSSAGRSALPSLIRADWSLYVVILYGPLHHVYVWLLGFGARVCVYVCNMCVRLGNNE